jgi:hypothetical protein
MFDLAIDSKLRGCDVVKVRIGVSFEELRRGRSSWAAPVPVVQTRDIISPKRPPSDAAAHRSVGGFADGQVWVFRSR